MRGFLILLKEKIDVDVTALDAEEMRVIDKALLNLNSLMQNSGVTGEDFLKINCDAFNFVRNSVGLPALNQESFQEIYFAGISGEPARFFNA